MIRVIRARIQEIAKQPELYRLRPEIGEDARLAVVGRYVILFRIRANTVRIERVVHGGRYLVQMLEEGEA
jgi:plasmid stabilization system protein ParE